MNAPLKKITFGQAFHMAMDEAMAADERVILLGEDIADGQGGGVYKTTLGLSAKYGDARVRSTPIAEQAIVGAAIGAALVGYRPVAEIMLMNFITVAMDQIVNHAAKLRFMSGGQTSVPITIRTISGAGRGFGGQHSDMLEAWFAHVPGLKIATASNPADAKGLLLSCIEDDNPCIFIENTPTYRTSGPPPEPGYRVPLGKAAVQREGRDISVIGYGRPIADALAVAGKLAEEGISVEVVDLRTIAPFDAETVLNSVAKTGRAVIVHEAVKEFGVGAEISSRIHEELFRDLKAPVARVGSRYAPVPFSPVLEKDWLYSQADIEAAIRKTLG
ncbi:alpha-ketoacid dehydrogenase subunit beta [Sandaracinobacteroides sayramensis]|uniref:alpha-ketoacid dehydrogenase subunit beta n=1 Tax=Sandaracinobacteroides sayramensis TaxID=2913411 RepID=UPI00300C55C9